MVLKLYGHPTSTCTLRVACILKEKNVPFEFYGVNLLKGEHKAPEFVARQPFGQVPYIEDDGLVLYESRAICRYIAAKYVNQGIPLIPTDPIANAYFEQAASVEMSNFDPYVSGLAWSLRFNVYFGKEIDEARAKTVRTEFATKLDGYDVILGKQKYLAGEEITLADLFHIPYAAVVLDIGIDEFSPRPNVKRWWDDITSRPSWQAVKNGV